MTTANKYRSDYFPLLKIDPGSGVPLVVQLQQQLTWLIVSDEIHKGERLPPVREFGRYLGINLHTVRSAYLKMEKRGLISSRQGSGTVVLDYDPSKLAETGTQTPSFIIGVVLPAIDNALYAAFIQGVEGASEDQPVMLLICNARDNPKTAERYCHQLIARNVDGIILASSGYLISEELERAFPHVVYVDEPEARKNSILIDARNAGYTATRHLLEHNYERIGMISAPLDWPNVREPYLGYLQAIQDAGLEFDPNLCIETPGFSVIFGEQAMQKMLRRSPEVEAVFAAGDLLAIGAMRGFRNAGRRIPYDGAVVGFDNNPLAELIDPPLTTVSIPMYDIGQKAMKMLEEIRSNKDASFERIVFQTELVIRESCGCQLS